ncbi:MAG: amidohydrolase family protein, partial [Actinomycetota bacterium]
MSGALLLRGGRVVDGSGAPWVRADVLVRDGRIAAVGRVDDASAEVIDVDGLVVCPGFIDMHTHSDLVPLYDRAHSSKALQGVTLEVIGQDGLSLAPATAAVEQELAEALAGWNGAPDLERGWRSVADYLARFDTGVATNGAFLVGHGTLRMIAMGCDERAPTPDELETMRRLLREALVDGAFGLAAGLTDAPGMYADDDEIVALCSAMAGTGAFYCPHHRSYGRGAAEAADVPIHLAHTHL